MCIESNGKRWNKTSKKSNKLLFNLFSMMRYNRVLSLIIILRIILPIQSNFNYVKGHILV